MGAEESKPDTSSREVESDPDAPTFGGGNLNQSNNVNKASTSDSDVHREMTSDGRHTVTESKPASSVFSNMFKRSDDQKAKYLIGNLENLPASAQKLFSMGKLYLTSSNNTGGRRNIENCHLFQTLNPSPMMESDCAEENNEGTQKVEEGASNSFQASVLNNFKTRTSNLFEPLQNSAPAQCAQTYVQWRATHNLLNMYSFCAPIKNVIFIQPIEHLPEFLTSFKFHAANSMTLNFYEMLQGFLQIFFFGMEVAIQQPVLVNDLELSVRTRFHEKTNQKQFCVTDLYANLYRIMPKNGRAIVGISWTDLYPEGFNFVLGEGSSTYKSAVVSFGRFETKNFDPETHQDISTVDGQLIWKLLKTISHEVCHVFGFHHCAFFLCAMNESSSVPEALQQPLFLCPVCLRKLQKVCGFDILDRYQHLHRFLSHIHAQLDDCQQLNGAIGWLDKCIEYLTTPDVVDGDVIASSVN